MFSEMLSAVRDNRLPDSGRLQTRFDFAMTKKMGILKLPPAYWMSDPKINPRSEELFWASLLLKDRERIDLALSIIAAEQEENSRNRRNEKRVGADEYAQELTEELLLQFSDVKIRDQLRKDLTMLIPEILRSQV